jgi:hypothetical protein
VHFVNKVERPDKVFARRSAPNGDGVIFVSEFVERRIGFLVVWKKNASTRTEHLDSFKQNFDDVFVHHKLCNFFGKEG